MAGGLLSELPSIDYVYLCTIFFSIIFILWKYRIYSINTTALRNVDIYKYLSVFTLIFSQLVLFWVEISIGELFLAVRAYLKVTTKKKNKFLVDIYVFHLSLYRKGCRVTSIGCRAMRAMQIAASNAKKDDVAYRRKAYRHDLYYTQTNVERNNAILSENTFHITLLLHLATRLNKCNLH